MANHLLLLLIFSAAVAAVFAALLRNDRRSRLRFGLFSFLAFVLSALAVGWLMYPFPS